jgi:antitoxin component YwqK of YwqJK toxin-antitoxin module
VLRGPCGFEGPRTTSIYDGTQKVNRVETWKNGVLQEQSAGTSDYANRSNVKYAEGKRQGVERVLDEQGQLAATISWNRGVKDGKEVAYAEGGTKVIKEIVWRVGVIAQVTEFYLNGNPKRKELHDAPERMLVEEYWDTGKTKRQGAYASCSRYGSQHWCEQGQHRSFFESGASAAEETYKQGQLHGARKSWWENGTLQAEEAYTDGRCTKRKRWDQQGKLEADEEYEADGSRKLKR